MTTASTDSANVKLAKEYFVRADAQSPDLLELFHPEFEMYFPKLGFVHGHGAFMQMASGFAGEMASIHHDFENYLFIENGSHVVAEGTSSGAMTDGRTWKAGETPGGRFCNVFQIKDGLIKSVHVYLDPDYVGDDEARFRWGRDGRSW